MKFSYLLLIIPFLLAATTADRNVVVPAPTKKELLTSPPTFPLAHNVTPQPHEIWVANKDGARVGTCEFDAINITDCELPSPIDATNTATLVIQAGANGAPLVSATDTTEGTVSLGSPYVWSAPQTFTQPINGDVTGNSATTSDTTVVRLSGDQTIDGNKKFAKSVIIDTATSIPEGIGFNVVIAEAGAAKAVIGIFNSTNANSAGFIQLNSSNGLARYLWIDTNGNLRLTADPNDIGTNNGVQVN